MSEIAESFASSLSELTVNSKPHINMLTMLAEDHLEFAPIITQTVLSHLQKVRAEVKLPVLYLIDSIVKNVGKAYINLFTQSIVQCFTNTFEKVDEKTREQMFKLRQTWGDVFPAKTIYALDARVHQIDPAWPLSAPPSTVHLNPKFFTADMLDSKSITSTIKQPEMAQIDNRSHHRKNKTYHPRTHSLSHSSRSKKASPTSSVSTESTAGPLKSSPTPEQLREQMILKQKMLLELQQQKLKLELLQTQAQLEEQQKQLEKQSMNHKSSSELTKLQQLVSQEEAKLKVLSKNLKKHIQLKHPKLQQIHRTTSDMKKAQKIGDVGKMATVPESLLKPAALLELNKDDIGIKPSKPPTAVVKPVVPKSKITQPQQPVEKQRIAAPADSTEEAPPPVRIAPVSSQLINAALSFGRNVRDPRIRQMSSRLESQLNSATAQTPPTPAPSIPPAPTTVPVKKPEPVPEAKNSDKNRKDKKSSNHHHKDRLSTKSADEESKSHTKTSNRSNDRSSRHSGKAEKSPPSKKSEDRNNKKSMIEDLFSSRSKSPVQVRTAPRTQSPSKLYSKRDQLNTAEVVEPVTKPSHLERISKAESSPKRSKMHENLEEIPNNDITNDALSVKHSHKLTVDIAIAQSIKESESSKPKISPEPLDSSAEMIDEDIEKIVKNPGIVSKLNKLPGVRLNTEESQESTKSSDDSVDDKLSDDKFDEIIKNPNKSKLKTTTFETQVDVKRDKNETKISDVLTEPVSSVSVTNSACNQNLLEEINVEKQSFHKPSENINLKSMQPIPPQNSKDPRLYNDPHLEKNIPETDISKVNLDVNVEVNSVSNKTEYETKLTDIHEVPSTEKLVPEVQHDMHMTFIQEEVVSTEVSAPEFEKCIPSDMQTDSHIQPSEATFGEPTEELVYSVTQESVSSVTQTSTSDSVAALKSSERLTLSPKKVQSPVKNVEPMETITEVVENVVPAVEVSSPKRYQIRSDSPVLQERKNRKGEKPSIMEQIITDAENHEASPSPPPPPIISDKFKEIKQSSLSRLRRVGRSREDLVDSESPEPADVDLRTQIRPPPTLTKDLKNEVLGLADKDVDLRNLPASPTKKRPSMEKLMDIPPAKKSKAEVMDDLAREVALVPGCQIRFLPARPDSAHWYNNSRICIYKRLFGSEDVDLRPVLCPPPPSPPPPPIISSSPPPDAAGERLWARYKQDKPDTYKVKYTPSRRDRAPSVDKFGRNLRLSSSEGRGGWQGRGRTFQEDIDMRAAPPGSSDGSYNQIIMQAMEQHTRGDLDHEAYKRVLSEVFAMREKQQLEEAQRRDEEAQAEQVEPISDDEFSGGSLSGVEDAPSPSESYSGGEDVDESSHKKSVIDKHKPILDEQDTQPSEHLKDVDIRVPPVDVDIRMKAPPPPRLDVDGKPVEEKLRKSRGESPYSRRSSDPDKERHRHRREELRALRREKKSRRSEEEREPRYRKHRYGQEPWAPLDGMKPPPSENMEVDEPRVPPIPHYDDKRSYRDPPLSIHPPRDFPPEQHDSPPMRPAPWEPQRMPSPWLPGMPPVMRGPPVLSMRPPQDRFMPPRWRPGLGPMFESEPGPRFNRFGPPPMGRFPVPLAPCEVPPTDPVVLKAIEEDPTKSINIDGVPRDIRFYGIYAVALMSWDDPREVSFQPGQRRVIIDDRDSQIVHFNTPPVEMLIDGKPHRVRFGAPTRELYIDNQWYEVFFGGPPVTCDIAGQPHTVQLEGPPPNVRPGAPRRDLVLGKITLIIDAEYLFTVYLDAKPQKFEVKGIPYIIRFVEALQKTVINGVAFKSDFGGLPRPIILNGSKHFFRLTALPRGVTPGYLTIVNMEGGRLPSPPTLPAPPQLPASLEQAVDFKPEVKKDQFLPPPMGLITAPPRLSPEVNREVETVLLHPVNIPPPVTSAPQIPPTQPSAANPLDMLTNLMPAPEPSRAVGDYNYSVDSENSNQAASTTAATVTNTTTSSAPMMTGEINVTELLQKLMATGIVPTLDQPKDKSQDKPVTPEATLIKPVDFRKPESLKIRQTALISHLYSGIQCNSCGVRFPPEQTMKYSQHLDWHFRQNRRDRDPSRTVQSRRYYYDVSDWVQFEEIEDLEERAQPWFEMQEGGGEEEESPRVLVSVRAADYPEEEVCQICHDKFESFYNEEKEEWHLRNAADHEGKLVHPLCLEDQRIAAEKPIVVDDIDITGDDPKDEEVQEKKNDEPTKVEDDDDIMEVTDIEFVKPVFPMEDLTVSDSESVVDTNEEKPEIVEEEKVDVEEKMIVEQSCEVTTTTEEIKTDVEGEEETTKEEVEKSEPETKDEDTQDDLVLLDKGDDSVLSTAEIMEVVRNIKKDPDTLGGEYEEIGLDPDVEVKKEKGEVPLPDPVVDTTHATVTCLIDGNVEFEETPQQLNVGGPPKIKINITKPAVQPAPKEIKESTESEVPDVEALTADLPPQLALVTQPPPPGEEPLPQYVKPKLIGRKMQELPLVRKGSEMSGLCSIM